MVGISFCCPIRSSISCRWSAGICFAASRNAAFTSSALSFAPLFCIAAFALFCSCAATLLFSFDRLSTAHFLDDTVIPVIGPLNSVTWFGVISLIGSGLGILASQLLIARMEKKGTVSRTSVVMSTSAGYILFLVLFAVGRSFWFMLLVFLLAGLMRTIKEPVLAAWMNDHVDEKMRATVFSTSGQLDSFGQIIGGPIVGLVAQQVSIPWGLVCTAFLLLPALFLVPVAGKKRD